MGFRVKFDTEKTKRDHDAFVEIMRSDPMFAVIGRAKDLCKAQFNSTMNDDNYSQTVVAIVQACMMHDISERLHSIGESLEAIADRSADAAAGGTQG